jgi:hypothetical protein
VVGIAVGAGKAVGTAVGSGAGAAVGTAVGAANVGGAAVGSAVCGAEPPQEPSRVASSTTGSQRLAVNIYGISICSLFCSVNSVNIKRTNQSPIVARIQDCRHYGALMRF